MIPLPAGRHEAGLARQAVKNKFIISPCWWLLVIVMIVIVIVITNIVIVLTCQPPGPVWWRGCWNTLLWGDMRWADWEIFLVCDHPGLAWSALPCLWCNCIENSWRAPQYKHLVISHANFTPSNWKSQHGEMLGHKMVVKLCGICTHFSDDKVVTRVTVPIKKIISL